MSDENTTPEVTPMLKEIFETATKDLYYPSESDEPFSYIEWHLPLETPLLQTEQLAQLLNKPNNPIDKWTLSDFFGPVVTEKEWFDDYQKAQTQQFKQLLQLLQENLTDIQVFRVGKIEIEVYVVGKTKDTWAGLKTLVVET